MILMSLLAEYPGGKMDNAPASEGRWSVLCCLLIRRCEGGERGDGEAMVMEGARGMCNGREGGWRREKRRRGSERIKRERKKGELAKGGKR